GHDDHRTLHAFPTRRSSDLEALRGVRMRLLGELEMRDRIARERVGAALKQHELGLAALEVSLDLFPGFEEMRVVRARRQRDVELRAFGRPAPGFGPAARPRGKESAVLVQIG